MMVFVIAQENTQAAGVSRETSSKIQFAHAWVSTALFFPIHESHPCNSPGEVVYISTFARH